MKRLWMIATSVVLGGAFVIRYAIGAGVPSQDPLYYTGLITESGSPPPDGPRSIVLRLWKSATSLDANDLACSTTRPNTPVTSGRFRIALDPSCPSAIAANPELWVEVEVGGVSLGRSKIGAVPFAIEAESAAHASGALAGQIVPQGMVAMFKGACPAGWSEDLEMRGRFPRGEPNGSASALDSGGSDDLVAVQHSHRVTGRSGSAAAHAHRVQGATSNTDGAHTHGYSGRTSGVGDHVHAQNNSANDCPGQPYVRRDYAGEGPSCIYPHLINTNGAGAHDHAFSGTTVSGGSHGHSVDVTSATGGAHDHELDLPTSLEGASGAGKNLPSYREVIFCVKD
jgi:hypothetical protein